jgi:hypothetical protein
MNMKPITPNGTEKPDLLDFLSIHAEHQILKYAAGQQIVCKNPECLVILDYKKTVMISFIDGGCLIICRKCYESERVQEILLKYAPQVKEITKFRKI